MRPLPCALLATLVLGLASPSRGAGQECPAGRISHVFIDNHSIFDLAQMDPAVRFRWAYQAANSVHVETRTEFIEDELLFRVGDCLSPLLLEESERILRSYPFIAGTDIFPVLQPDGTQHVVVDTRDEWTTKVGVSLRVEDGIQLDGLNLTEENFAGRGITAGFFFKDKDEQRDLGGRIESPRLFSTRLGGAVSAGTTRVGSFFTEEVFYPFVGEVGRVAARQSFSARESLFAYRVSGNPLIEKVFLPIEERRFESGLALRIGHPGNLTLLGVGLSWETLRFPGFSGDVQVSSDGRVEGATPADPSVLTQLTGQVSEGTTARLNFLIGQRNIRFIQRRGLDGLTGVEDVRVGSEVNLALGRSVAALGRDDTHEADDLFTRVDIFMGAAPGRWVSATSVRFEGRQVFSGGLRGDGWRDLVAELDSYLYFRPSSVPAHTFFARMSGAGGWSLESPFQLTLGGSTGVRGYHEDSFPGAQRIVISIEDRIRFSWPAPDLFDLGATLFVDAGRIWDGTVPFGVNSGVKASVGAGLRVGFPAGTRSVARIDVALPLTNSLSLGGLVVRISVSEVLGLLPGFSDRQLERSRRIGLSRTLLESQ